MIFCLALIPLIALSLALAALIVAAIYAAWADYIDVRGARARMADSEGTITVEELGRELGLQ